MLFVAFLLNDIKELPTLLVKANCRPTGVWGDLPIHNMNINPTKLARYCHEV